jgi:hypothetical protein
MKHAIAIVLFCGSFIAISAIAQTVSPMSMSTPARYDDTRVTAKKTEQTADDNTPRHPKLHNASKLRTPFETKKTPFQLGLTRQYSQRSEAIQVASVFCQKLAYEGTQTWFPDFVALETDYTIICYDTGV